MRNLFEAVGLKLKHRSTHFQEVRHQDEVPVLKNKTQFPYQCELKYDGNFAVLLVQNGKVDGFFSRTGNEFNNTGALLARCKPFKKDGMYLGELYVEKSVCSLEKFSGCISSFRKNKLTGPQQIIVDQDMKFAMYDFITIKEYTAGVSNLLHQDRYHRLLGNLKKLIKKPQPDHLIIAKRETCNSQEEIDKFFKKMVKAGNEGIVIKGNHTYISGHKNFHFMKKVKQVTHDLTCTGYEDGAGKMKGIIANLFFEYKGEEVKCSGGKGWDMEMLTDMYKSALKPKKGRSPVGKIFEVYALEESSKGLLRLPKFGELRTDKVEPDVTFKLEKLKTSKKVEVKPTKKEIKASAKKVKKEQEAEALRLAEEEKTKANDYREYKKDKMATKKAEKKAKKGKKGKKSKKW